jgi:small ligand-binding sensory domain FIST
VIVWIHSGSPPVTPMQWTCALSSKASLEAALHDAIDRARANLAGEPTLGFLFISSAFTSEYSRVMPLITEKLTNVPLIGCSGGGIIGTTADGKVREAEDEIAISLVLAHLPGVTVVPFHVDTDRLPDLDGSPGAWSRLIGADPASSPCFVMLSDPFSRGIKDLLAGMDYAYFGAPKIGGVASSGIVNGSIGLFAHGRMYREGTVGLAMSGNIEMETIVAQGCRPIGEPFRVTESERNIILKMETEPARSSGRTKPLEQLQALVQELDEEDRLLAQSALFVGVAQTEFKMSLGAGDFLVRNLMGYDPKEGALAVGDRIRPGQRIQFHLRDAETSAEDLKTLLRVHRMKSMEKSTAIGALMFACLGRGEALYDQPNYDSRMFAEHLGMMPMAGFFCNGEIGPVGDNTYLHGFTSVFGIFRSKV